MPWHDCHYSFHMQQKLKLVLQEQTLHSWWYLMIAVFQQLTQAVKHRLQLVFLKPTAFHKNLVMQQAVYC